ncbi:MAG: hypothetical protein ACLFMY_06035 [Guyparkeria sp.]|uniref:hypothetical protein n=1 Tax=Guyparkeria sp. TaxID=2035736 RepID=UPI003979BAA8
MNTRIHRLITWRPRAWVPAHELRPSIQPASLADLVAHYRDGLPVLRPRFFDRLDRTTQARIDGLITAALLVDGWLEAPTDRRKGRPMRLPSDELADCRVEDAHFEEKRVDFAFRRFNERFAGQIRRVLQGAAPLGRPWFGGLRYRLAIARIEQVLRERQVDPALWFEERPARPAVTRLVATTRITWRVLTGRG